MTLRISMCGFFLFSSIALCRGANLEFNENVWSFWPRKTSASFNVVSPYKSEVISKNEIDEFSIYTYCALKENKNYELSFSYKLKNIKASKPSSLQVILNYNEKDRQNASVGSIKFFLDLILQKDKWQKFCREIKTPEKTDKCQLAIKVSKIKGSICFADLKLNEVKDKFEIYKTEKPPVIDGILDDQCWAEAFPISNFYCPDNNAAPAKCQTKAYISYDTENFYIAFVNEEKEMNFLKAEMREKDTALWTDDCNEIFIKAPSDRFYQFIVNAIATKWDGTVFVKVPGDPYDGDPEWDGKWVCSSSRGENSWITEMAISFSNFDAYPKEGAIWHLNLGRERKSSSENSHINRVVANFKNVSKYATLKFSSNSAEFSRYSERTLQKPFNIERKNPKYQELLSDTPGFYKTGIWSSDAVFHYYPPALKKKYTSESFATEQENILTEYAMAHIVGPAFPWLPSYIDGGIEKFDEFHEKYGMKSFFVLFSSAQDKAAISKGAKYISRSFVDPNDPQYQIVIENYIKKYFSKNKKNLRYIDFIFGKDEPTNNLFDAYSLSMNLKNKQALTELDKKIKEKFGFNKFGIYDVCNNNKKNAPFNMIAFMKWWNSSFFEKTKAQRALLKKYAPGIKFLSFNQNCVKGIGKENIPLLSANTDYISADPYPSSAMYNFGRKRAILHVGFTVKLLKDISQKPLCVFIQAFSYCGYNPKASDIREWASQALKNGAEYLIWFTSGNNPPLRVALPKTYKELLRLSNIINKMKKLKRCEKTKTGIFFSEPSFLGNFDDAAHSMYSIYSILGEQLKSWFRFVSANALALKMDSLGKYDLIYIPALNYSDKKTAVALLDYVKNGGLLVVFDPKALSWNVNGTSMDNLNLQITGVLPKKNIKAKKIIMKTECFGLKKGDELPLTPISNRTGHGNFYAFEITPPEDAKIFAIFPNGTPAAFERNVGKGKVIYFAAQPFGNSELALKKSNWSVFMKALAEKVNEKLNIPIWDFELPDAGSEIKVNYLVNPKF